MKKKLLVLTLGTGMLMGVLPSCGGKGSEPPAEENLVISATPALNGQQEAPGVGPTFPLSVTITSKMPAQGVKIDVGATVEGTTTNNFFTDSKTTSSSVTNFIIANTPQATSCRVTVTVTSLSNSANKASGFYLYSMK